MAAGANNFSLVGDAFAVSAAIFFLFGRDAIAGGVGAFLLAGHSALLHAGGPGIARYDAGSLIRDGGRRGSFLAPGGYGRQICANQNRLECILFHLRGPCFYTVQPRCKRCNSGSHATALLLTRDSLWALLSPGHKSNNLLPHCHFALICGTSLAIAKATDNDPCLQEPELPPRSKLI